MPDISQPKPLPEASGPAFRRALPSTEREKTRRVALNEPSPGLKVPSGLSLLDSIEYRLAMINPIRLDYFSMLQAEYFLSGRLRRELFPYFLLADTATDYPSGAAYRDFMPFKKEMDGRWETIEEGDPINLHTYRLIAGLTIELRGLQKLSHVTDESTGYLAKEAEHFADFVTRNPLFFCYSQKEFPSLLLYGDVGQKGFLRSFAGIRDFYDLNCLALDGRLVNFIRKSMTNRRLSLARKESPVAERRRSMLLSGDSGLARSEKGEKEMQYENSLEAFKDPAFEGPGGGGNFADEIIYSESRPHKIAAVERFFDVRPEMSKLRAGTVLLYRAGLDFAVRSAALKHDTKGEFVNRTWQGDHVLVEAICKLTGKKPATVRGWLAAHRPSLVALISEVDKL